MEVEIIAGEVVLQGLLAIPPKARAAVAFAHGSGSSRLSPRNGYVAKKLNDAGIATLLLDLLTPEEDLDYDMRFDIELLASRLVLASGWLKSQASTKQLALGFFGASTGAAAALKAAAKSEVFALVSRGGRPDLASDEDLAAVKCPTLLMVGGLDDVVIELNRRAYEALRCEKSLVVIPGATHLFEEPGKLEKVAEEAVSWFSRHVAPST